MEVTQRGTIGRIITNNRIVRSATNDYRGGEDKTVSMEQVGIYKELARSNVGLIITGNFAISEDGAIDSNQNALLTSKQRESARMISDACHEYKKPVVLQLSHAGLKTRIPKYQGSDLYDVNKMTHDEIKKVINMFAICTLEAKMLGFDGVQIHLSHGYLLSDFLNPSVNKRSDEFGLLEDGDWIINPLFSKIRYLVGDGYPILVKITSYIDKLSKEKNDKFLENLSKRVEKAGVSSIELSGLNLPSFGKNDHLYYGDCINVVKKETNIPLILTGGLRNMEDVNKAISLGADFVGFSRPFIRNPLFANDLLAAKESECISCNACYSLKEKGSKRCGFLK